MSALLPSALLPPISFQLALGPLLIEASVGLFLSGIMTAQAYFYWDNYQRDPLWTKMVAYSVCALEIVNTAFSLHSMYSYLVLEVGNSLIVAYIVWSSSAIFILQILVIALVQGFCIHRIWKLSHSIVTTALAGSALCLRCAFGLATGILAYVFNSVIEFFTNRAVQVTVNMGLILGVVVDIMTSGLLIYYLRKRGARARQTKRIVRRLMFYSVNTGAMAIAFSMLTLFTFNLVKFSSMSSGFVIISTKVYANSLLAMLNARNKMKTSVAKAIHSIPLTTQNAHARQTDHETAAGRIAVQITTETTCDEAGTISACSAEASKSHGSLLESSRSTLV